jgi:acyl-CoA synthetase (NDP forming)
MKVDFEKLDRAFNPQCVTVVGDKAQTDYMWLRAQRTFKGRLYSVQVDPNEIKGIKTLGVKNYGSLLEIPEPVDLVIVAVPRAVAPRILEDCIQKDVGAAHFFTSGFAETNTEEGIKLAKTLSERARQANFHLIGPNCMGIYIPSSGIRQTMWQKTGFKGNIGFISQSGTHAGTFSQEAYLQGLEINKSVSFGNGLVLDSTDYLEYFGHDPGIKAVGMYLEGVKDGNRFLKVLREVASQKAVVIWKGGRTEEGGRAIASHTGSLAVPRVIWDAAVRQGGALKVNGMEELADTLKAILSLSRVFGNRVGIAGGSGGQSVAIADVFAEAGLKVPTLTQASYDRLSSFFLLVGSAYKNPIDPGVNRKEMRRILEILEQDANIDNLILLETILPMRRSSKQREAYINALIDIRQKSPKPVAAILGPASPEMMEEVGAFINKLREGGIPTFLNLERGARALKNTLDYYRLKEKRIE